MQHLDEQAVGDISMIYSKLISFEEEAQLLWIMFLFVDSFQVILTIFVSSLTFKREELKNKTITRSHPPEELDARVWKGRAKD